MSTDGEGLKISVSYKGSTRNKQADKNS